MDDADAEADDDDDDDADDGDESEDEAEEEDEGSSSTPILHRLCVYVSQPYPTLRGLGMYCVICDK